MFLRRRRRIDSSKKLYTFNTIQRDNNKFMQFQCSNI
ncbi:unnamed protein product [Schistosoma curassoni]|uniref:Uncharacterized protein n=1 Tax=Schistosoma curassoni TaxID=6186 RepID=A0A183K6C6_9TREM|nr:unnamed protein product [Schistosoma curassoni]